MKARQVDRVIKARGALQVLAHDLASEEPHVSKLLFKTVVALDEVLVAHNAALDAKRRGD